MILPALLAVLALLLLAAASLPLAGPAATRLVYAGSGLVCLCLLAIAFLAMGAPPSALTLPLGPPGAGAHFTLDQLSAAFLTLTGLGGLGASLYALGYGAHAAAPHRVLPFFPLFIAAMTLVLLAADAYAFLFAWELMSLASWALVVSNHRTPGTLGAAHLYLLMASGGTLTLILAFGLMAQQAGSLSFAAMAAHPAQGGAAALVFVLLLLGTGSKAGLVPLHAWLPQAHPAAPSHVSALMSAVMTKIAIYAFIRVSFGLLGSPAWWWGVPVLVLGGVTAALGVLYALMETDLKRILAYSTIENIGIIFVALGLALAFRGNALTDAAALALAAALFHAFNHMLFKSVLFFGAGAVQTATGGRDLERLGGLIHAMPRSAAAMLVAALAIAALPPLNGFASEWLVFQSILLSPHLDRMALRMLVPAIGVLLALAAALAAACFVRAYGAAYLGRPRSAAAAAAREADRWSVSVMLAGAGLCGLVGVLPGFVLDWLRPVTALLVAGTMPRQAAVGWLSIAPVSASRSSYNSLILSGFLVAAATLTAALIHRFASRAVRRAPAWDCGFPDPSPATQYSATSLAQPLRRVFATLLFADRSIVTLPPPGSVAPARLATARRDPVWTFGYAPLGRAVQAAAGQLNRLQFLTIRSYLSFVFATLILLLLLLTLWS